ncbi:hypothetical protein CVCC1112_1564 [Paenarthrobacter nicotinovorans]|nr:hypothetical protein CVCC1112_1564 [Paenarthrobacter nicotinovorans]
MDRTRFLVRSTTPDMELTRLYAGFYEGGSLDMQSRGLRPL